MGIWPKLKELFHKNPFFIETALSGWLYVYHAKSKIEIIFWYSVILIFISITLFNVCQLVIFFLSQQVSFKLLLASSSVSFGIPEIYITLQLPALELFNRLPSAILHEHCARTTSKTWLYDQSFMVVYDYLCMLSSAPSLQSSDVGQSEGDQRLRDIFLSQIMLENLQASFETQRFPDLRAKSHKRRPSINDPTALKRWKSEMKKTQDEFLYYMNAVISTPVKNQIQCDIMEHMHKLSNRPLADRSNDSLVKLLFLEALNTGVDPQTKIFKMDSSKSTADLLQGAGISARELLESSLQDLADVFYIQLDPPASVYFQNWTFDSIINMESKNFASRQTLDLKIKLPTEAKTVRIQVYSYATMWLYHLLDAWHQLVTQYADSNPSEHFAVCHFYEFDRPLFDHIWDFWYFYQSVFYREIYTSLGLKFSFGDHVQLSSGTGHRVTLIPSMYLHSQIHSCYNDSLSSCVDECLMQSHIEKCDCVPWSFSSQVSAQIKLCLKPCLAAKSREQCTESCSAKTSHSCSMIIAHTDVEYGRKTQGKGDTFQVFDLEVNIAEGSNYVQAVAEYEMPSNRFLSLLGGSIEFWGVFTMMAILHMVAYIVIQNTSSKSSSIDAQNSAVDIESVKCEVEAAVESLRERVRKHKVKGFERLWLWFKNSNFHQQTPMIGYGYIAAATSVIEVVFWWLVMIVFGICAAVNIYYVAERFVANPTHINALPIAYEQSIAIPNFTMLLHLPLCELSSKLFYFYPHFDINKHYDLSELNDIQLEMQVLLGYEKNETIKTIGTVLADYVKHQLTNPNITSQEQKAKGKEDIFQKEILQEWEEIKHEAFDRTVNLTAETFQNPLGTAEYLQKRMGELLAKPLEHGQRDDLITKLLLLHEIKHGNATFGNLQLSFSELQNVVNQQNLNTDQLLAGALWSLGEMLHISTSNEAKIQLTDIHFNAPWSFGLELQIELPPDTNEMEIRVRSLMKEWITLLYDQYYDAVVKFKRDAKFETKANPLIFIFHTMFEHLYMWYRSETYALLTAPNLAVPFLSTQSDREVKIGVAIKWQLISTTNDCAEQDNYNSCLDECMREAYISACSCIPWHMIQAPNSDKLCSQPCAKANERPCHAECSIEPCKIQTYTLGSPELLGNNDNFKNALQFRLYTQQVCYSTSRFC